VEHIDKKGKPLLYLVFEYLDTDLKKYIDSYGRGNKNPLPTSIIKVTFLASYKILSYIFAGAC
jgi:cyclin-dependent kinase